jgi:hypothetical protein
VFLSSIQFAKDVLSDFNKSVLSQNINQTYSFLLGDFWGDPREADTLFTLIEDLVTGGHKVYALRNDINGTEMLQEHMASIRYNSTEWHRNKWLQEYWKKYFNCTDLSPCNMSQSLPPVNRPILRNYKASLVMDSVLLVRKFAEDFYFTYGFLPPDQEVDYDLYELTNPKNNISLQSNWTNNSFIYGQAGDTNASHTFEWNQPIEWQFRMIELYSLNDTLWDWEYGIWTIGRQGLESSDGSLIIFDYNPTTPSSFVALNNSNETIVDGDFNGNNSTHSSDSTSNTVPKMKLQNPVFGTCVTSSPPTTPIIVYNPCNPDKLHGMVNLVIVIIVLLLVVSLIYMCHDSGGISGLKHLLRSPGKDVLMLLTIFSVIISFWIIFGDEALDCENRADDFLVSLANGIYFSVLLIYVACRRFENRLGKLCLKIFGFLGLVLIQLVLSSVAHLDRVEKLTGNDTSNNMVQHCFDERGKSIAAGSYWFGGTILLGCIALLFLDICWKRDEDGHSNRLIDFIKVFCSVAVGIVYIVALVFVLGTDDESKCLDHGRFFIFLAFFPAILSLLIATILVLIELYEHRKHLKEMAALDLECKSQFWATKC